MKAAKAATFVHVSGHLPAGFHRETFDLTVKVGEGATGSFAIDGPGGHQKVDLVVIGLGARMPCPKCKSYMRANTAFWKYNGPAAGITSWQSLAGKWVEFPPDSFVLEGFALHFADLNSYFDILTSHMRPTTQDATTYEGQSVVAVSGPSMIQTIYGSSKTEKVYVAATGTPYPALIAVNGTASASVAFDHWGQSVKLTAPSGAVAASKLGG